MKKLLLILALSLLPSLVWGQNPTCPTRSLGDSTNACASTAFVQSAKGNLNVLIVTGVGTSTWTTPVGTTTSTIFEVECTGGGGGGGATDYDAIGQDANYQIYWTTYTGGGGSGATAISQYSGLSVGTIFTFTIGGGGRGGHTSNYNCNATTGVCLNTALANNPFTTVLGSSSVTVTHAGHGFVLNNIGGTQPGILFSGATAVGGLDLNGAWSLTSIIGANSYVIRKTTTPITNIAESATSSATGGGAGVLARQLGLPGGDSAVAVPGYSAMTALGGGAWNNAGYGPPNTCLNQTLACYAGHQGSDLLQVFGGGFTSKGGESLWGGGGWSGNAGGFAGGGGGGGVTVSAANPIPGGQGQCIVRWM